MVFLQVFGQGGEIFSQQVLERLLFLRINDLTGREGQAELLHRVLDLPRHQPGDIVSAVLAEADDDGNVSVCFSVGADDVLQLLVDERQPFFIREQTHDGELGDEAQVGPQFAHVG